MLFTFVLAGGRVQAVRCGAGSFLFCRVAFCFAGMLFESQNHPWERIFISRDEISRGESSLGENFHRDENSGEESSLREDFHQQG